MPNKILRVLISVLSPTSKHLSWVFSSSIQRSSFMQWQQDGIWLLPQKPPFLPLTLERHLSQKERAKSSIHKNILYFSSPIFSLPLLCLLPRHISSPLFLLYVKTGPLFLPFSLSTFFPLKMLYRRSSQKSSFRTISHEMLR